MASCGECGKKVVAFRAAKGPEDPYRKVTDSFTICTPKDSSFSMQAFREAGFAVHFVPVLRFEFSSHQELATALLDASQYSGPFIHPL